MQIRFELNDQEREFHTCESRREGNWLVFTCPQCIEYETRFNIQTGERISHPIADPTIFHQGTHIPVGLEGEHVHSN